MVLWLHSAMIILIKGCLALPASQNCPHEKKVLSFLLTLSLWVEITVQKNTKGQERQTLIHSTNTY